jgi:hypothetical protein
VIVHPNIADARPLLVVGSPRCGTRFVANALNSHPKIHLNAEIPLQAMTASEEWLRRLSNAYEGFAAHPRRGQWSKGWESSRHQMIYAIWGTLIKSVFKPPEHPVDWYGYKTPHHERFWPLWRDLFPDDRQPRYVFCIRNFLDHSRSQQAKTPAVTIERLASEYRQSVNTYADMKAQLGESVSLFVLDDLAPGGIDYVRSTLFDRLGIPVDDDILAGIDPGRPINDGASMGQSKRQYTEEERAFLELNGDLLTALDQIREARPIGALNY